MTLASTQPGVSTPFEGGARLGGLAWRDGRIEVRKTGVRLKVDSPLISEIAHWAIYLVILAVAAVVSQLHTRRRTRIWYAPDLPGPWYLLRGTALWAGFGLAASPENADAAFYFDDTTKGWSPPNPGVTVFNGGCTDISKAHVAEVFAEVFGYAIGVDPRYASGPIVEKSDKNGVHDGRVVMAPVWPREGCAYQRLVDTRGADGMVHDLRTPCVAGAPVVVWEKTKTAADRFAIHNRQAVLRDPATVFSPEELDRIGRFNAKMGLDWGGLDILRDRLDGRIYVVDVNKTDLGPVIALSWPDKIRSMNRLSRALDRMVARTRPEPLPARSDSAAPARGWAALSPIAAAALLMAAWAWLLPRNEVITAIGRHAVALQDWARSHPAAATAIFVMAYATAVAVMLPVALIMTFVGGWLLGAPAGGLGSIAGATLGAIAAYGFARLWPAGPHRLEDRFPRLRTLREDFANRPFRYILSMRLMPLTPFTLVSLAAGLNRIGLAPLILGTALGVAPECVVYAAVGSGLARRPEPGGSFRFATIDQPVVWGGFAILAALAWITMRIGGQRAKAGAPFKSR